MVFSIDLKDPSVRCALKTRKAAGNAATERDFGFIDRDLAGLLKGEGGAVGWSLDKKRQKLFFELPALSRRGLRPQDIVSKVFGLENPAFFLTRERFIFADC
jgi:hypothetical protein